MQSSRMAASHSLHMLRLFIVLFGLEGLYLHVPVWMGQKGSRFRERTCCNLAGFVPTMDLDETSVEVS